LKGMTATQVIEGKEYPAKWWYHNFRGWQGSKKN